MTTTVVVWNAYTPSEEDAILINNKAAEMQLEGKTDNEPIIVITEPGHVTHTTRTWTTLADAEEWILFVEQYTPVSATIES